MERNMEAKLEAKINKATEELKKRIKENGGHWCEVTMKESNIKLVITREGLTAFEDLANDRFMVVNGARTVFCRTLKEVARIICIMDWRQEDE